MTPASSRTDSALICGETISGPVHRISMPLSSRASSCRYGEAVTEGVAISPQYSVGQNKNSPSVPCALS